MKQNSGWTMILPFLLLVGCGDTGGTRVENASVTGHISADQIWSGEIRLTGDVWIDEGVTVTVEPGTTIRVAANSDD